jgi:hypothetical protein
MTKIDDDVVSLMMYLNQDDDDDEFKDIINIFANMDNNNPFTIVNGKFALNPTSTIKNINKNVVDNVNSFVSLLRENLDYSDIKQIFNALQTGGISKATKFINDSIKIKEDVKFKIIGFFNTIKFLSFIIPFLYQLLFSKNSSIPAQSTLQQQENRENGEDGEGRLSRRTSISSTDGLHFLDTTETNPPNTETNPPNTNQLNQNTNPLNQNTNPLNQNTNLLNQNTNQLNQNTNPLNQNTNPLNQNPLLDQQQEREREEREEQEQTPNQGFFSFFNIFNFSRENKVDEQILSSVATDFNQQPENEKRNIIANIRKYIKGNYSVNKLNEPEKIIVKLIENKILTLTEPEKKKRNHTSKITTKIKKSGLNPHNQRLEINIDNYGNNMNQTVDETLYSILNENGDTTLYENTETFTQKQKK